MSEKNGEVGGGDRSPEAVDAEIEFGDVPLLLGA